MARFGVYALGLIPGCSSPAPCLTPADGLTVVRASAGLSLAASLVLVAGSHSAALLFLGRLLARVRSGTVFAAWHRVAW